MSRRTGQRGAQSSLFIRGGDSDANKILVDGVSAGDLGGRFDFGPLSTTAVESAEVYRGPNSSLYGADAASGVVSLTTPHGTTSFPSFLFHGDAGNFSTSREDLEVAGAHNKLDYLGAFSWLQTANDLPNDEFHVATTAANLGWQPSGSTQIRATLHYGVDATGVPNAWAVLSRRRQRHAEGSGHLSERVHRQPDHRGLPQYRALRPDPQARAIQPVARRAARVIYDAYGDSFGDVVTITGANGYSVTGQALLDYSGTYPQGYQLVSNRDQLVYQGDYTSRRTWPR